MGEFQSTLPVGGATCGIIDRSVNAIAISIHAPCGGSDLWRISDLRRCVRFQSTLPVGGATKDRRVTTAPYNAFQSTLPVGGATAKIYRYMQEYRISIHAPCGGSDRPFGVIRGQCNGNFNPRSLWGERPPAPKASKTPYNNFNPRSLWGERRNSLPFSIRLSIFQSTLPVGGATRHTARRYWTWDYFNPRSLWGERLIYLIVVIRFAKFQSTLPVGGATIGGHSAFII